MQPQAPKPNKRGQKGKKTGEKRGKGEVGIKENEDEPIEAEYVSTDEYIEEEVIENG